jgi:hypothetical protein
MTAASDAMERVQFHLALAGAHADRLGRLLRLGLDEEGRPSLLVLPYARHLLAAALREASDACEELGVQQGDLRWTAPVALLHNASTHVWTVRDAPTCGQIAALMERMRVTVVTLRERSLGRAISVRLS